MLKKSRCVILLSTAFNRGVDNENILFQTLYKSCDINSKSYVVFEEPDRKCSQKRNKNTIPFDFLFIKLFFRKIGFSEQRIGEIFSNLFLEDFLVKI